MGLFEEPRYILQNVCNQFHEMPENTIREQTFCCGSGSGPGHRREHGDAHAGRASRGPMPSSYVHEQARGQPAGLHLRHRQGDAAAADGVLGAGGGGGRACTSWWATPWSWTAKKERTTDLRGRTSPGLEAKEEGEAACMIERHDHHGARLFRRSGHFPDLVQPGPAGRHRIPRSKLGHAGQAERNACSTEELHERLRT